MVGQGSSLGSRRPNAANLPALTGLPPPPMAALHDKYQPPYGTSNTFPHGSINSVTSLGNLLTPPNTLVGDSGLANSVPSVSAAPPLPSFQQQSGSFWPNGLPAIPQYGLYNSGSSPGTWIPPRGMYSPSSIDGLMNQPRTIPLNGSMSATSFELNQLAPFTSSVPMTGSIALPPMQAAQSMSGMNGAYMSGTVPTSGASSLSSPALAQDSFLNRLPPTPAYFTQSQTSSNVQSPGTFGYASVPSISQDPPISPSDASDQLSSANSLSRTTSAGLPTSQSPHQYQRPAFSPFQNPSLSRSVMSNLHRPNSQMSLIGNGVSSAGMGYSNSNSAIINNNFSGGSMQSMYGAHHSPPLDSNAPAPQHQTPSDRPFKCDACPQSFNRNHDLKRHKRIHLAVKPYPCGYCDKSFSRKDALKVLSHATHQTQTR